MPARGRRGKTRRRARHPETFLLRDEWLNLIRAFINQKKMHAMFLVQEWMWMALALILVTFAGTLRSLALAWASVAATILSGIIWADPSVPLLHQVLIFGLITLAGIALSQFFIKPKPEEESAETEDEKPVKAPTPAKVINRTFTLSEPIVDGAGKIEIDGTLWRLRGEDAEAGEQIRVLGVDGLQLDVLIVTKEKWAKNFTHEPRRE